MGWGREEKQKGNLEGEKTGRFYQLCNFLSGF